MTFEIVEMDWDEYLFREKGKIAALRNDLENDARSLCIFVMNEEEGFCTEAPQIELDFITGSLILDAVESVLTQEIENERALKVDR